jgi:hypothetical protein
MIKASVEIAPIYSFKPIDLDHGSPADPLLDPNLSSDSLDIEPGMSPTEIFRESGEGDCMVEDASLLFVQRANPIDEQQSGAAGEDDDDEDMEEGSCCRVISPYPFSHTSKEEIEEREQLTSVFDWNLQAADSENTAARHEKKFSIQVDYSRFFELGEAVNDQAMDDCDDFSLSSHEANSLSEDLCLASISEDPASFWEDGVGPIVSDRNESPTQVSLGSAEA